MTDRYIPIREWALNVLGENEKIRILDKDLRKQRESGNMTEIRSTLIIMKARAELLLEEIAHAMEAEA